MKYGQLKLQELIDILKSENPEKVVPVGFGQPDSYRGYYYELAFEPTENVTVGSMLAFAEAAMGKTFQGYKGGDFLMNGETYVNIADYGCCDDNDEITEARLLGMLGRCCPTCGQSIPTAVQHD